MRSRIVCYSAVLLALFTYLLISDVKVSNATIVEEKVSAVYYIHPDDVHHTHEPIVSWDKYDSQTIHLFDVTYNNEAQDSGGYVGNEWYDDQATFTISDELKAMINSLWSLPWDTHDLWNSNVGYDADNDTYRYEYGFGSNTYGFWLSVTKTPDPTHSDHIVWLEIYDEATPSILGEVRFNNITVEPIQPVPEPATMLLFGTGLIGLAGVTIRRRKK